MKRFLNLIFIGALFFTHALNAQVWSTVGNGFNETPTIGEGIASFTYNSEIYVAFQTLGSNGNSSTHVKRWDGLTWHSYPILNAYRGTSLIVENGIIYVSGYSQSPSLNVAFYEFDGNNNNWIARSPSGYSGSSPDIIAFNGEIICSESKFPFNFTTVYRWDGNSFSSFPPINMYKFPIRSFSVINGELYATNPNSPSGVSLGLLKWDGSSWASIASKRIPSNLWTGWIGGVNRVFQFQNKLYVNAAHNLWEIRNDSVILVDYLYGSIFSTIEHNGIMYIGDTTSLRTFDGTSISLLANSPSATGLNELNGDLYAFGPLPFAGSPNNNANAYKTSGNFSLLNGNVYFDKNNNCTKDLNDTDVHPFLIDVNSQWVASTNSAGYFSLLVPPGTYPMNYYPRVNINSKNLTPSCTTPSQVTIATGQMQQLSLAFENTVSNDLNISIISNIGWRSRFGFDESFKVRVTNTGNLSQNNVDVTVVLPPTVNFVSSLPSTTSINANTLTFNLGIIGGLDFKDIDLIATIDTSQNNLDSILKWASYFTTPIVGDVDPSDNMDTLCTKVVGAVDPNDKTPSETMVFPGTSSLDYHIRFQNTGNDTAYNITVVDTLESSIDISSVVINAASHPYQFSIKENILIWKFENILLPDSSTDLQGSQGYINFSTSIDPTLSIGDTVRNQVQIYFDFQAPVFTNTAKTAVIQWIGLVEELEFKAFEVFPNPANDILFLENYLNKNIAVQVMNTEGRLIRTINIEAFGTAQINIQELDPGLYILVSGESKFKLVVQ